MILSDMVSLISCPPAATGWAAPMLVPGAMAATSAAMVIMTPAEAARAPLGEHTPPPAPGWRRWIERSGASTRPRRRGVQQDDQGGRICRKPLWMASATNSATPGPIGSATVTVMITPNMRTRMSTSTTEDQWAASAFCHGIRHGAHSFVLNLPNLNIKLPIVERFRQLSKKSLFIDPRVWQDQRRTSEGVEPLQRDTQ
jgi:hypothetical protein